MAEDRFSNIAKRFRHTVAMWRTRGAATMSLQLWGKWVLLGRV